MGSSPSARMRPGRWQAGGGAGARGAEGTLGAGRGAGMGLPPPGGAVCVGHRRTGVDSGAPAERAQPGASLLDRAGVAGARGASCDGSPGTRAGAGVRAPPPPRPDPAPLRSRRDAGRRRAARPELPAAPRSCTSGPGEWQGAGRVGASAPGPALRPPPGSGGADRPRQ